MIWPHLFSDRAEAGRALAKSLSMRKFVDPVVLALPRGGVPVASEVARVVGAPLDLVMVRKIGLPFQPELAAAAVVNGDKPEVVINEEVMAHNDVDNDYIAERAKAELVEIERRRAVYLGDRPKIPLEGRTLILVDDGIATGTSVRAAIAALKRKCPKSLILAVPVAPRKTIDLLRDKVDEVVCLMTPDPFYSVGTHYRDFHQITDEEVTNCLHS